MEGKGCEIERRSRKCREFGLKKGEVREKYRRVEKEMREGKGRVEGEGGMKREGNEK